MTTYNTNFSGYTDDVKPSDWTERWVTASNTWATRSKSNTDGGKVLENTGTVDGRHLLSWDAIDADVNRANVEILARVRSSSILAEQFRLTARGSGAAGSETGYNILFDTSSSSFRLHKYVAGASTLLGTGETVTQVANVFYYVRFRVNGSDLMAKAWADSEPEPDFWQVTTSDTSISAAGWVGVGNQESTGTRDFDFVSVGTNGDSAPFVTNTGTVIRTSQLALEVGYTGDAKARMSQMVLEVAYSDPPDAFISQMVLEVAYLNGSEAPTSTQQPKMVTMF